MRASVSGIDLPAREGRIVELIRQAIPGRFGHSAVDPAAGVALRHDPGTAYLSAAFQQVVTFLGIASFPAVGEQKLADAQPARS